MKRIGNIYNDITLLDNCIDACDNVVKYKKDRNKAGSLPFDVGVNREYYGYMISEMLKNKTFVPSSPDFFVIEEGISQKRREIYAPKLYPDQLVHWAVMQVVAPIISDGFYEYSCGNILGRGAEYIRRYLSRMLKPDTENHNKIRTHYKYCLKLDIHHFFQSIDRDIVMEILETKIKDKEVIDLIRSIVWTPDSGTGLPIGFYTSQWLANMYLNKFDHWLVKLLGGTFEKFIYVRYVDDMVIVASNKRKLQRIKDQISEYLNINLKLRLKYDTNDQIFNIARRPIDFIGYKFTYGKTTVRNKVYHRALAADKRLNKGKYSIHNLSSVISYDGYMNKANCYLAKKNLYKHDTNFYKVKLKQLQHGPENKKLLASQSAICNFKSSIQRMNEAEFNDGNISRVIVYRNSRGKVKMKKEIIAKVT